VASKSLKKVKNYAAINATCVNPYFSQSFYGFVFNKLILFTALIIYDIIAVPS